MGSPASSTSLPCHATARLLLVHKHDVATRRRRHKGMLAFLAHDADTRVLCYAHGQLQKAEHNDEMLQCVASWEQRTCSGPQ